MTVYRRSGRGRWMVDVQIEHADGSKERERKVSPRNTRRGAEQYERELRQAMLDGTRREQKEEEPVVRREVPSFESFVATFIDNYAKTNNEESTVREKQRTIRRALLPFFGPMRLDDIGARDIEAFKASRLAGKTTRGTKRKNKTVNEELAILAKILRVAHEWGDIDAVPPIRRLKTQAPDFDFFDFDEAERLFEAAKTRCSPWNAMIPTAMLTGLRIGELRALQWNDVDLVARRIHVRRAADDKGKLKSPKNGRSRIVDLPERAVEILRAHKHLRGPFVFCRDDGSMLQRQDCEAESVEEAGDGELGHACRRAGLRRIGWHGLRHTYASHLVMRGASLTAVKELMGHCSITMTMRYAHLSPAHRRGAVDLLDEAPPWHHGGTALKTSS